MPKDHSALGDVPLSVIFAGDSTDFRKVYNHGVKHGHGTEKAKQHLAAWLRNMEQTEEFDQMVNLLLSRNSRFVYAEGKAKTQFTENITNNRCIGSEFTLRQDFMFSTESYITSKEWKFLVVNNGHCEILESAFKSY